MKRISYLALLLLFLFPAAARAEVLQPVQYPGATSTYRCYAPIVTVQPGQNLNLMRFFSTCPQAEKVSGSGPAQPEGAGYITRWEPGMVELLPGGGTRTPQVDDLHLHHAVWLKNMSQPYFAVGEEKTIVSLPEGYGVPSSPADTWGFNYMIHSLNDRPSRQVRITWEIDWVPTSLLSLQETRVRWLDVAGAPQIYPVFDAERKFDTDSDGRFVFPDEVSSADHEEYGKISPQRSWSVTSDVTLVFTAGHLHPGGLWNDLWVQRGDEVKKLFRSRAQFFGPQTAVSWDISMEATPRDWRIHLRSGDRVFTNVTYDVSRASWYEGMGIMPLAYSPGHDVGGVDPFAEAFNQEGILTHGRLPENIDLGAGKNLGLKNPARLPSGRKYPKRIGISSFVYSPGGFSARRGFPSRYMRPPLVRTPLLFFNSDALSSMSQEEQIWHTITSCRLPCTRGSGISYPLADGRFDSGQLGYGINDISGAIGGEYGYWNSEVTTSSASWRTPKLRRGTYAYFCRIHPFMRGSFRVKK